MLGSFARIDLDSDQASNQSDINSYITSRIAQFAERKGISTNLVKHIEKTFREKSEDTFLWVSFMADDLEKQTVSGIEKALQTLPTGLDEIYEQILLHIKPENTAIIATMLQWISLALRPLTVPQLAEAMRIQASIHLSKEELCISYIESCGHLLQVSHIDLRVTFVHQSVKDFLFGLPGHHMISAFLVKKAQGDLDIACQLLSFMQNEWLDCLGGTSRFREVDAYPLAQYARWNWELHLQQLQDKSLWQVIDRNPFFFSDSSAIRDKWRRASITMQYNEDLNLLQFACESGLTALVNKLLKRKRLTAPFTFQRYINQPNSGPSALGLAVNGGNMKLVRLLLTYKANIELPCGILSKQSALHYAAEKGHLEIFQLFVEKASGQRIIDADREASHTGVKFNSLLHLAAISGNSQLCRSLIERYHYKADLVGASGQTPICDAIQSNSLDLARIFVGQWGASITPADKIIEAVAESRRYFAQRQSRAMLKFVISELKIDINTRNEAGETILHLAFQRMEGTWYNLLTYYKFATRCLELGADPSLRATNGDAPFHLYEWFGYGAVSSLRPVILLLHDGRLSVNDQGNCGNTLLHKFIQSAFNRNGAKDKIFKELPSLLDVGADRSLVNSQKMTALQLAKMLYDDRAVIYRTEYNIRTLEDIVDILENYATVSNHPQKLNPLDWPLE
jgi:ankyrin repeat protein